MNGERITIDPQKKIEAFTLKGADEERLVDFFRLNTTGDLKAFTEEDFRGEVINTVAGQAGGDNLPDVKPWILLRNYSDESSLDIIFADSDALSLGVGQKVKVSLGHFHPRGETALYIAPFSNVLWLNNQYGRWLMTKLNELSGTFSESANWSG